MTRAVIGIGQKKRFFNRKEERKASRQEKKKRKVVFRQNRIDIRKKTAIAPSVLVSKKPVQIVPAKSQITQDSEDEEIFSESDAYKSEEEKGDSTSSEEDDDFGSDDYLSYLDQAFESGTLTKKGFVDDDKSAKNLGDSEEEDDVDLEEEDVDLEEEESSESDASELGEAKAQEAAASIPEKTKEITSIEDAKLLKLIQSSVNKLGSSNLVPIANEFEGYFRSYRRKEVIETLTRTLLASIVRPGGNLLDSFTVNFAALSFLINHMVGIEFGAHLIEKLIETIDSLYAEAKSAAAHNMEASERSLINCMSFCSFLYDLQIISSKLICDLMRQSAESLREIDVEIILKLFKSCGTQIRRDDAEFMKQITLQIGQKAGILSNQGALLSTRFRFMMETIEDLNESRRRLASAMGVDLEPIKKALRNFLNQKSLSKMEPLRVSLEDVRNIESKGKWWLIGASWHPQQAAAMEKNSSLQEVDKMEQLAKAQRMNTQLRRTIFSTLVSSEDYLDAFDRLLALRLSGRQEREIILVIVHCCGQEKQFNPFYALLLEKFAKYHRSFQMTLRYILWDTLKQLNDFSIHRLANTGRLFGWLLGKQALPFVSLRKASFLAMSEAVRVFWQLCFMGLFTQAESGAGDEEVLSIAHKFMDALNGTASATFKLNSNSAVGGKPKILTENVDLAEFDDEFFLSKDDQPTNQVNPEKLEELKNLRNGAIYFLSSHFEAVSAANLPFKNGIESAQKRAKLFKQVLQQSSFK